MHQPISPALDTLITQMPKAELHLHLEGSITPGTLLRIAERNHVDLPARDEAGVAQLFQYNNFQEFLTVFMVLARSSSAARISSCWPMSWATTWLIKTCATPK